MPEFTQWTVPDPAPNVLYNPAAVDKAANETIQGRQQIGAADMEMVGRAASSLLGMSEADAAAAYPGMVADLQRQGFGRYAPPTYPGHAAVQGLVQRALPLAQQNQYGWISPPGLNEAIDESNKLLTPGSTGARGGGGGGGGGVGSGGSFLSALANIESGDQNIVSGTDKDSRGLTVAQGGNPAEISQGHFQIQTATWRDFAKQAGVDVDQYPNAMSAPREVQARVASVIPFNRFGPRTQQMMRERFGPIDTSQTVGALAGLGPRAGNAAVAGPAVTPTPAVAAPPPFNPNAGPRVAGAQPAAPPDAPPPGAPGGMTPVGVNPNAPVHFPPPVQTSAADVPVPPSPIALRTGGTDVAGPGAGQTTLPAVPAQNRMYQTGIPGIEIQAPGNALAPPVMTAQAPASPVAAAAVPPAATPTPPVSSPPATGINSPQFQKAQELNRAAADLLSRYPNNPRAQAQAAALKTQAALYMQADSVSYDSVSGIGTKALTGERLNAAAPNARYEWDDQRGAYVDKSGTHPPVTPPSPRLTNVPGVGVVQSKSGGGADVVIPMNPQGIATQAAAQAQGTGVGGDVAKQLPALAAQGRDATQAIGNIDYGMNQLREAARAGIPSGYFAPWLATASAAAKSLGFTDTMSALGIDPAAVGNVQSAQKTLGVVAGAILQQAIGSGSQITDAKIQHFIHTQPGIETDPQALERVLNWARSQFVYENEMSKAAMIEAANSPTGTLPLNWQARYYRDKGFAPIYDPVTGEMRQPEGRTPSREPPPSPPPTAPVNPTARTAGTTYWTPKGSLKWTGTGWVSP